MGERGAPLVNVCQCINECVMKIINAAVWWDEPPHVHTMLCSLHMKQAACADSGLVVILGNAAGLCSSDPLTHQWWWERAISYGSGSRAELIKASSSARVPPLNTHTDAARCVTPAANTLFVLNFPEAFSFFSDLFNCTKKRFIKPKHRIWKKHQNQQIWALTGPEGFGINSENQQKLTNSDRKWTSEHALELTEPELKGSQWILDISVI